MTELARANGGPDHLTRRALNQAARELLLAQSSDWAFIMKTNPRLRYPEQRTREHLKNFESLRKMLTEGPVDEAAVTSLAERNNLFPRIDFSVFAQPDHF